MVSRSNGLEKLWLCYKGKIYATLNHSISFTICSRTQVKSQGIICKSSWAFSATGAMEAQYRKVWGQLVSLSEQQLIDCSGMYGNKGCTGGTVQNAFEYIHKAGGICTANSYSYLGYVSYSHNYGKTCSTCTVYFR